MKALTMYSDPASATLAEMITKNSSMQSYITIQTLVPRPLRGDAFRAYAYFRWVDDLLDGNTLDSEQRFDFLVSQQELLSRCLQGQPPRDLSSGEWLLADLTQGPLKADPGLRIYLQDMMAVMAFDVERRNRRIHRQELTRYSRLLATAVTEAVYTFIGDRCGAPKTVARYLAADAAHIIHMLRDLRNDLDAGYINIPIEDVPGEVLDEDFLESLSMRTWVQERIATARRYFAEGEAYLASVASPRCRMAGALYTARFEGVIEAIGGERYILRRDYSDCMGTRNLMRMVWRGSRAAVAHPSTPTNLPEATRTKVWLGEGSVLLGDKGQKE